MAKASMSFTQHDSRQERLRYALAASRMSGRRFFSSRRRHTRFDCDWSSDVSSSDLQELGLGQSAIALQLERPLGERLVEPVRKAIARQVSRLTPAAQAASFQRELDFIGNPFGLDPAGVQTLRIAAGAGLGALRAVLGIVIRFPVAIIVRLAGGAGLGFYLPTLWLRQLVNER